MTISAETLEHLFEPLVRHLSAEDREHLRRALVPRTVPAGQRLLTHGALSKTLYLVVEGTLEITLEAAGQVLRLGTRGPGQWVGEMGMIRPGPASADVTVEEPAVLWTLSHEAFQALRRARCTATARLLERITWDLAERLRHSTHGTFRRGPEGQFELRPAAERHGGPLGLLRRLFGGGGTE